MNDILDRLRQRDEQIKDRGGDMLYRGDGDPLIREAKTEIERLRTALTAERERCAKIADMRAAVWSEALDKGTHEDCSMSLLEECEDIAAAIRAPSVLSDGG